MKTIDVTQKRELSFPTLDTKMADGAPRTLVVKISTPTPDRSGDVVLPAGMDSKNFMNNPVVQFAHKYDEVPIAKCTSLKATDTGIMATVEFPAEGMYPKADLVYHMYKEKFLNAWSIGFMPLEDGYTENEKGGYTFTKWELLEFSSVPVPANAEALTVMRSKGFNVDALKEVKLVEKKEEKKEVNPALVEAETKIKELTEANKKLADEVVKSGRSISARNEAMLKQSIELLQNVLASIDQTDNTDDGKSVTPSMIKRLSQQLKTVDQSAGLALHIIKNMRKSTPPASGDERSKTK